MQIEELSAIVTGASSGMGRHFALSLCREGARVAAFDVNPEGLSSLAREAQALKGALKTFEVNVAREDEVVGGVAKAFEAVGPINALVNNAGIFRDGLLVKPDKATGKVERLSLAHWQAVLDVDLTGPFLMTREVAATMIEAKVARGVVVNISSVSRHGNTGQSNYSAAKAGLVADTKLWAQELARYHIRVGAIAPGFVRTPLLEGMRPEMLEKLTSGVPLKRLGEPAEIFAGIRFIVECEYFTGRCIDIDGGLVL
jgi:3-oxoacyl-[acyl-carrier protein] reductase